MGSNNIAAVTMMMKRRRGSVEHHWNIRCIEPPGPCRVNVYSAHELCPAIANERGTVRNVSRVPGNCQSAALVQTARRIRPPVNCNPCCPPSTRRGKHALQVAPDRPPPTNTRSLL